MTHKKTTKTIKPMNAIKSKTKINYLVPNIFKQLSDNELLFVLTYFKTNSLTETRRELNLTKEDIGRLINEPKIYHSLQEMKLESNRQAFKQKFLTLEELGSYVSNMLTNTTPYTNELSTKERLDAVNILTSIHSLINRISKNPVLLENIEVEGDLINKLQSMSIEQIKSYVPEINSKYVNNSIAKDKK